MRNSAAHRSNHAQRLALVAVGAPGPADLALWHVNKLAVGSGHLDIRDLTAGVGVISAMDAARFAVLVLYVIQVLHQRPGAYGVLLAIGAIGGIAAGVLQHPTPRPAS